MDDELILVTKGMSTLQAQIGLLSSVDPLVGFELVPVPEAFPTLWARVWLLPCVDPLVKPQAFGVPKGFPALWAGIGLLSSVDSLVDRQRVPPPERFPTHEAGVGLFPRVDSLVDGEFILAPEGLPTLLAGKRLLSGVEPLVHYQVTPELESFPTLGASVGLLPNVDNFLVFLEVFFVLEGLLAPRARERGPLPVPLDHRLLFLGCRLLGRPKRHLSQSALLLTWPGEASRTLLLALLPRLAPGHAPCRKNQRSFPDTEVPASHPFLLVPLRCKAQHQPRESLCPSTLFQVSPRTTPPEQHNSRPRSRPDGHNKV